MNNFELFKLKKAGLSNRQINHVLNYQKSYDKSLSIRDIAVISRCKQPSMFIHNYRNLVISEIKEEFLRYQCISILDKNYPIELSRIYNPPVLLFYQGDIALLEGIKLAFVGARDASQVGIASVQKIIKDLGNQFTIVSGLARGIDTAAHLSCLKNGGKTIAVIGTGLNCYYPKENKELQEYISKNHLLLSEYLPDTPPLKFHFPERNRIIAGLSQGIVVCDAKKRSGSLITCERALEEGREVFAIPGNILDGKSDGCHYLISEGAKCISTGHDILTEFQLL